jgi:hypothetical protein
MARIMNLTPVRPIPSVKSSVVLATNSSASRMKRSPVGV